MRITVPLFLVVLSLPGCATQLVGRDDLCREIATFANGTVPGGSHAVSLETAWGSSRKHPESIVSRDCHHSRYTPGARLCGYLMEHSAAEFPENNFRRALACLTRTPRRKENYVSYERLDVKVSAYGAYGVREDVEVTVEFKPNREDGTMQLDIGAEALKLEP